MQTYQTTFTELPYCQLTGGIAFGRDVCLASLSVVVGIAHDKTGENEEEIDSQKSMKAILFGIAIGECYSLKEVRDKHTQCCHSAQTVENVLGWLSDVSVLCHYFSESISMSFFTPCDAPSLMCMMFCELLKATSFGSIRYIGVPGRTWRDSPAAG